MRVYFVLLSYILKVVYVTADCEGDKNATFTECAYPCPSTCSVPNAIPCKKKCISECQCNYSYLISDGKCILPEDCPGGFPCRENETFVGCNVRCPPDYCPENDDRNIAVCDAPYPCPSGCACKNNYRRKSFTDDTCILASDCPEVECTRVNEVWNPCSPLGFTESCDDIGKEDKEYTETTDCYPQCVCKKGFKRNNNDECIPIAKCPRKPLQCGPNEVATVCPSDHKSCDDSSLTTCERECKCIENYIRNLDGVCVSYDECSSQHDLKCGINEVPTDCAIVCPPQSCEISYTEYSCGETKCKPGCNCIKDYLRNKDGVCIFNEECPLPPTLPQCGDNEIATLCAQQCPPQTCDFSPDEYACKPGPCQPGCDCIDGYLRDSNGTCIPKEQCKKDPELPQCGDNEVASLCKQQCPPQTCSFLSGKYACKPGPCQPGCNCIDGYLRDSNRKCIPKEQCNKVSCGKNETYVSCYAGCPTLNCPVNDNRAYIACDPPYPCPPGCACLKGYKRIYEGGNCILATECPPVNCTRPNEKWNPCQEPCYPDLCRDLKAPRGPCDLDHWSCTPQCSCIEGFLRNDSDICIPKCDCPK